ncbi:MAG: hypothetical protein PSV23_10955 [Brevundimonas sp.]|uniref:GFA family protein n=1 Tax=Brevundimonas sp. TaxID=1871086 RepID=UPI002489F141|nr:hypothetical protein [Brevundimonas sp.]MDI1327304.1 hypothetical protein [Brevundimonas sp.]
MRNPSPTIVARCRCGQVALEATGRPILTVACYCDSCRKAAAELEALPEAPPVLGADGGTDFLLFRKDRVRPAAGAGRLGEHRLSADAKTRRVVAGCCNSPMFLEFEHGHWLSLYRDRFDPEARPPLEMRTMTGDLGPEVRLDDAVPSAATHTPGFMWKLLAAWAAMGFRTPGVDYVQGRVGR